jgi:AhpD family alkylhydroperoxidase
MQARLNNPAMIVPGAMKALQALGRAVQGLDVPSTTLDLIHLRASQINGCSVCVDMHSRDLRAAGETDERLFSVAAWRERVYEVRYLDTTPLAGSAPHAAGALANPGDEVGDATPG